MFLDRIRPWGTIGLTGVGVLLLIGVRNTGQQWMRVALYIDLVLMVSLGTW